MMAVLGHLRVEPGGPAGDARPARDEPPDGQRRADAVRRGLRAARGGARDDRPDRARSRASSGVEADRRVASAGPTSSRTSRPAGSRSSPPTTSLLDDARRHARRRAQPGRGDGALPDGRARQRRRVAGSASTDVGDGVLVDIGGHWFAVIGILEPLPLAPEIDRSALIGLPIAKRAVRRDRLADDDLRPRGRRGDRRRPVGPAGDGQPGEPGGGRGQPAVGGASRRRPRRRRRSPRCSSVSGPWRCSSAGSASPT